MVDRPSPIRKNSPKPVQKPDQKPVQKSDYDYVPLMFQAQVQGRSQIQYLEKLKDKAEKLGVPQDTLSQQAYDWYDQWSYGIDRQHSPQFDATVKTKPYRISWRLVTNSGQDAGVIRPVMGAGGWAFFPGSSMKGAFRRAAVGILSFDVLGLFCGIDDGNGDFKPGILRFHGGYPIDTSWMNESVIDVVHPQEDWQLEGEKGRGALVQISLYQPTFQFGISSSEELTPEQWKQVWQVWDAAMGRGIGSRVSAGYGQVKGLGSPPLLSVKLSGSGIAPSRISKTGLTKGLPSEAEFRPNLFKGALRGHTRRILHGLVDVDSAERLTKMLWGGVGKGEDSAIVGKLGIGMNTPDLDLYFKNRAIVYETGDMTLNLLAMPHLTLDEQKSVKAFAIQLMKFSLLFGGFGKSWRRVEHSRFYNEYFDDSRKCALYIPIVELTDVTRFLDGLQAKITALPMLQKLQPKSPNSTLKEAWKKGNVQVWGRIAADVEDSIAVEWFHGAYDRGQSIYRSELTGRMGNNKQPTQIGRIWHRMYPRYLPPIAEKKPPRETEEFVELLTIFPNITGDAAELKKTEEFLKFLAETGEFQRLW
jgi:CRISPR-associated protein Cmr6